MRNPYLVLSDGNAAMAAIQPALGHQFRFPLRDNLPSLLVVNILFGATTHRIPVQKPSS